MSAAQLLELDFFHEWSVHVKCNPASTPDVFQFRVCDDVIRNRKEHQKDDVKEFEFNVKLDSLELVVEELVRKGPQVM